MIFTPWGIGLTTGSLAVLMLLMRATIPALFLIFRGEEDDSEFQLRLEREEVLTSTICRFALCYLIISPFLLTAAAFELGRQIPGAMCALGTLNANKFGFPLIFVRLTGIYPACAWIVLYSLDMREAETPLRGIRRILTPIISVWFILDTTLQTLFLLNLSPQVITSCCAVVFDPTSGLLENPAGLLATYPGPFAFYFVSTVLLGLGIISLIRRDVYCRLPGIIYGLTAPLYFFFGLAAMTSFISPYIYALPHHHCPFCILTGKEALIGIPMTLLIFIGGLYGWTAGTTQCASGFLDPSNYSLIRQRRYQLVSVISFALFVVGSAGIIILYRIYGELL